MAFEEILARAGSDRDVRVLRGRLSFQPQTLQELAKALGVTRERVRQLQKTAEENITAAAAELGFEEVSWRAQELRRQLGAAIRLDSPHVQGLLTQFLDGLPAEHRDVGASILLWLAGRYHYDKRNGWIQAGEATDAGPPAAASFLSSLADSDGRIDRDALESALADYGFVEAARAAWLAEEPHIREVAGSLFCWYGTVVDKAESVLLALGEPATADELNALIAEGHNVRGLRGRLLSDERFIRTDRARVGLRAWGLEQYTGIVDEIGEEIDARGGEALLEAVISAVAERFELRLASVESYSTVPRFVVTGDRIRRRRPDEPYIPQRTAVDEAGCYVLDENRCVLRLRIEKEVLRGSGRPLPQGLGSWLGVFPGAKRVLHVDETDTVLVSWPDSALMGPSLGSIRKQVVAAGGADGDHALLTFDRTSDTLQVHVVKHETLKQTASLPRLELLTGIETNGSHHAEAVLANAVGATHSDQLRARLRLRGESDLSELLELAPDPALDDALSRLKDVL